MAISSGLSGIMPVNYDPFSPFCVAVQVRRAGAPPAERATGRP